MGSESKREAAERARRLREAFARDLADILRPDSEDGFTESVENEPIPAHPYDLDHEEAFTPHDHREYVANCFRCELSRSEVQEATK